MSETRGNPRFEARDARVNHPIVVEAISRVSVPAASIAGATLLVVALVTGDLGAAALGLTGLSVAVVGWVERLRGGSDAFPVLFLASAGVGLAVPLLQVGEALVLLPTVILFALVGVFSLPRRVALFFQTWCGLVTAWILAVSLADLTAAEVVVGVVVLTTTGFAGWRFLSLASDALVEEHESSGWLFESSPVAILEEDFHLVGSWLDDLRAGGVVDLRSHLSENPDLVRHGISLLRIRRANAAAVSVTEAGSAEDLVRSFGDLPREDLELGAFIEQFVAIWEGRRSLALDLKGLTVEGRPMEAVLNWYVPVSRGRSDLGRVIVAISDITPRKKVEERLARAVESNKQLLAFERALAACSRALLLGVGEDALEVALQALREAMNADRSYLAMNFEDPEVGLAFKVVNSASRPECAQDDWIGMAVPWSKYPMAEEPLANGRPFRHLASEDSGRGWNRSLLAVPVFTGGEWTGTVGFVDIGRKTTWSDEAVRMLEVAAPMLGNFWEREVTRQRLEDLVQSKDRFVASVSHELRTPLSAVLGFAEELKAHANTFEPHEATEILELIAEQSRDMADMVEDLLVAARADIGTISIQPQEVYLRAQAEAALVALGSTATTTVEIVGGPGKTWADPTRTRQIMRNLVTNAVRYGGDKVVIEASTEGDITVLTVRDNGDGLPEEDWQRIFEPYERAHERPSQPASVGLGLTVSRQLARVMGGDLIYQADDGGSSFELTLPSAPPEHRASFDIVQTSEAASSTA